MAQSGYTPILIYASGTATNVPLAANMTSSASGAELALNYADGKLYYKNSAGTVTLLASTAGASGDVVGPASATDNALARFDTTTGKLIQNSVGILSDTGALSGLTDISASGSVTLSGGTANGVAYLNGSKVLTTGSALVFDGTNLGVGGTPSAWFSNYKAFQINTNGSLTSNTDFFAFTNNLFVNSAGDDKYLTSAYGGRYRFVSSNGQHQWFNAPSGTAGNTATLTQAMTLDSSGNLLIGQTGTGLQAARSFSFQGVGDGSCYVSHSTANASGDSYIQFGYNATKIGSITQNGTTATAYNTSSDYRLKNITGPITSSGAYIDSLNPVEGTWKVDGSVFVGLIAHEAQEVSRTPIATGEKDGVEMQGMSYSNSEMIANMIAELKSLRARVAQLESN